MGSARLLVDRHRHDSVTPDERAKPWRVIDMSAIGRLIAGAGGVGLVAATATVAVAMSFGPWSPAASAESIPGTSGNLNTSALEGCPFVAQRGDVLYFASSRAGGMGGLDIWYSLRDESGAWGDPVNFAEVNSPANELCPMAHRNGKTFLFVSARPGGCGGDDLYMTRRHATRGWAAPVNLGCAVNSAANEASPSLLETELYFSSTRLGGLGDIYVSPFDGVSFGTPALAAGLNTAQDDFRPNLRRDGLEVFFDSNRPGGIGGLDLWTSTRASTADAWSTPTNLGSAVNSSANDLRASLSWDGTTLYFGSLRAGGEGSQDLYVITR
jgi:Tol biopolymer transport system component